MPTKRKHLTLIVAALLLLGTCASVAPVGASAPRQEEACRSVTPSLITDIPNPTCDDACGGTGLSIEKSESETYAGTYSFDGGRSITIEVTEHNSNGDEVGFSWTASFPVSGVIVKAADGANLYSYEPPAYAGCDLITPTNPEGINNGRIGHLIFCYQDVAIQPLQVSQTASTSYTRTYNWDIAKSVDQPELNVTAGPATANYTVTVTKGEAEDSDFSVNGTITIHNPTDYEATITGISDTLSDGTAAEVDWPGGPVTLEAGGTLEYTYAASPAEGSATGNTVTVTTTGPVNGGSNTVGLDFGEPTTEVNAGATVTDTFAGPWNLTDSDVLTYQRTFDCSDEGMVVNTAAISGTDVSATAEVEVICEADGYSLEVSKTASTSFTRTYNWTIDKSVDHDTWDLTDGDSRTSMYTVAVTRLGYQDSGWKAEGTIAIHNPTESTATIVNIFDVLSGGIGATVQCPVDLPYDLAPGATLECSYTADLPNAETRLNTVIVATSGDVSGDSATADVSFAEADVTAVNGTVHVKDSQFSGDPWTFRNTGSVSYQKTFDCDDDDQTLVNTATIIETGQQDSATVRVNCERHKEPASKPSPDPTETPVPVATPIFILPVTGSEHAAAAAPTGLVGFVWSLWQSIALWWRRLFAS